MRLRLSSLLALAVFLGGCATKPQMPVDLTPAALSPQQRVGVAMSKVPKPTVHLPGAGCLLCIMAATVANSSLSKHADTLDAEDLVVVREQIATALRTKGVTAVVIPDAVEVDKLADVAPSESNPNAARKDFGPLKQKYTVDKLVLIQVHEIGFERPYSAYIPTSDPKGYVNGVGYMVDLSKNTYDWYRPVVVRKAANGAWDEPAKFPGLTNAYYQAIEIGREQLLQPFKP